MAITRTQSFPEAHTSGSGTTLSTGSLSGVAAGCLVVGNASNDSGGGATVTSVTDDLSVASVIGNQYNDAAGFAQNYAQYHFKNYGGGTRTLTLTLSVSAPWRSISGYELAGGDTVAPAGPVNHATGTSTSITSGAVTPARDGAYFLGISQGPAAITISSPFTLLLDNTQGQSGSEYIQSTAASQAAVATQSPSGAYCSLVSTFYPSTTSSTPPQSRGLRLAIQQRMG